MEPCRRAWRRWESTILLSTQTQQRPGRHAFDTSSLLSRAAIDEPSIEPPVDVLRLAELLRAAHVLAQPGFMVLHAVREDARIVDFEWDKASRVAAQLLCGTDIGLPGRSLRDVLAERPARGDIVNIFNHYRHVVEFGAPRAVQHGSKINAPVAVLRHAAEPRDDGVAVTLTSMNALRRELALHREVQARSLMVAPQSHK